MTNTTTNQLIIQYKRIVSQLQTKHLQQTQQKQQTQ